MKNEGWEASLARLPAKERERTSACMAEIKEEVLTWTEGKKARLAVTCDAQEKDKRAETDGTQKEAPDGHVDGQDQASQIKTPGNEDKYQGRRRRSEAAREGQMAV